jgi:MFS family permease
LFGLSLLALAATTALWLAIIVLLVVGYGMITAMAGCNTLLQSLVPDQLRGRVMSLYTLFFLGTATIGSLIAGAMAAEVGTPITIAAGGVGAILGAIVFWHALPGIRRHIHEEGLLPPDEVIPVG